MVISKNLITILVFSVLASAVELDISVPSLPDISDYFQISDGLAQMTISVNFTAYAIACVLVGPLSEIYGRRPMMIVGNAIMLIGSIGCVLSESIEILLLCRFFQGLGASTSPVLMYTMISDVYKGSKATKSIGQVTSLLTIFMAIAPLAGGFINEQLGWRGNYAVVFIICLSSWLFLVLKLPETKTNFEELSWLQIGRSYLTIITNKIFISGAFIPLLGYAGFISFITSSPFLYMETFKLPMMEYVLHQGAIILAFSITSMYIGQIINLLGEKKSIIYGINLCLIALILLLIVSIFIPKLSTSIMPYLTTICMMLYVIGIAFGRAIIFAKVMEIYPRFKGSASSVISGLRMIISAIAISITGYFCSGTLVLIALAMLTITIVIYILVKRFLNEFSFE